MLHVVLNRFEEVEQTTFGHLKILGIHHPPMYTLEEAWKDNARGKSCVPGGQYMVNPHNWNNDGHRLERVWCLQDVPGRDGICMHSANTIDEIEGCIAPGFSIGRLRDKPAVLSSKSAIEVLRHLIGNASFLLTITPTPQKVLK